MGKLNWQRVILGGLLAGVIINAVEWLVNGVVFADDWAAAMKDLNRSGVLSAGQIGALNLWGFLTGITMVWLYAAIRPMYGTGPKTAAIAGAAMWFMNYALGSAFPLVSQMFPLRLFAITLLIGLGEAIAAAMAGAWVYREAAAPLPRVANA